MDVHADELERFCRAEYPRLVGSLTLYTGDPELAPDLAQARVAMNLAKSAFRRRAVERRVIERLASRRHEAGQPDGSRASEVRALVAGLPERQRMAVILRYWADFTVADTAEAMGIDV